MARENKHRFAGIPQGRRDVASERTPGRAHDARDWLAGLVLATALFSAPLALAEVDDATSEAAQPAGPESPATEAKSAAPAPSPAPVTPPITRTPTLAAPPTTVPALIVSNTGTASDLIRRGALQNRTGEYTEGLAAFEAAITAIEAAHGRWDKQLIVPLVGYGDAHLALGDIDEAIEGYERAQHITRINDGLHSPAQIPVLQRVAEALAARGELQDATLEQYSALRISMREYGEYGLDLVPSLYQMGAWHRRVGNIFNARVVYERIIDIIEQRVSPSDLSLVPALALYASTFADQRAPAAEAAAANNEPVPSLLYDPLAPNGYATGGYFSANGVLNRYAYGERALRRALEIQAARGSDDIDALIRRLTDMGDWYILFDKPQRAAEQYRLAVELNSVDEGRKALYDEPTPLSVFIPPPASAAPFPGRRAEPEAGYIELQFDVNHRGRVSNVEIVEARPSGQVDVRARRGLREARFRPRFEGADPVVTEGVTYRHEFMWRPRRETKPDDSATEPAANDDDATPTEEPQHG